MKRSRLYITLLLVFIFTFQSVSCTRGKAPVNTAFDGETLYRGLIFRSGPVARRVPELWSLLGSVPRPPSDKSVETLRNSANRLASRDKEASAALNKIADAVSAGAIPPGSPTELTSDATIDATIAAIRASDSTFFARFADHVQSGDPLKVERGMVEASELTMQVLRERINSDDQWRAPVWYYWDIAVAIEVAAVVLIVLLAVFPLVTADNDLVHDDVVKIITERFYVQRSTPQPVG